MVKAASILAVASLAAVTAFAVGPATRAATVYDGLATFELPKDWVEIPPQELEDATMWAAEATAGRLVEIYQYGFRPVRANVDHGLPQLMIQVRESGRVRWGQVRKLPPLETLKENAQAAFPVAVPPIIVGLELVDVTFDKDRFVLRMEHRLDLRLRGEVRVLTAAFLTERGWLVFHLSDRQIRIDAARQLFDKIVDSVRLDPAIAYDPRLSDRWPGLPFFIAAALTAAALAVWLATRRRTGS